jgi:predicted enzyme related to lactoylglutathione lyase
MRREAMGPSQGAVFAYDMAAGGVGGALMMGPTAPTLATGGTLVYLDASPSLDAALERTLAAGGQVALPRQALPPGMGFFAHITDLDGNRVGLHALV